MTVFILDIEVKKITDLESTYKNLEIEGFAQKSREESCLVYICVKFGYNEEFYTKALKIRRLIQDDTKKFFKAMTHSFHQ